MKALVCALLLVCVLIVVIAPQVDLPPTVLRTAQRLILPLLAALALVFTVRVQANQVTLDLPWLREKPSPPLLSRSSTICVLLC